MTLLKKVGLFDKIGLFDNVGLFKGAGLFNSLPFPSILKDGNTVKWFDYLLNITKSGSNLTSVWDNKPGIPGIIPGALLQAVEADQPLWTPDGILFNGISQFMKTAPFTFVQPEMIYIVLKQVTWTHNAYIFDGNASVSGILYQLNTTPNLLIYAGVNSGNNTNLPIDTYGIVRVLINGASSSFQINETTAVTGNFGALDMGGFTLGANAGSSNWGNIQVKEIILRKIADTAQGEQDIYDYLAAKYSI